MALLSFIKRPRDWQSVHSPPDTFIFLSLIQQFFLSLQHSTVLQGLEQEFKTSSNATRRRTNRGPASLVYVAVRRGFPGDRTSARAEAMRGGGRGEEGGGETKEKDEGGRERGEMEMEGELDERGGIDEGGNGRGEGEGGGAIRKGRWKRGSGSGRVGGAGGRGEGEGARQTIAAIAIIIVDIIIFIVNIMIKITI